MNVRKFFLFDRRRKILKIRKYVVIWIILIIFLLYFWKKVIFNSPFYSNSSKLNSCQTYDIVYTWVNGSDPNLIEIIKKYNNNYDPSRYSDKNELKYSLRSIEKYAKWFRHIYIITNGQIPYWLDLTNPKITIISHIELSINPDKHLPTFSSSAIETFVHKIPNLSQQFLYLNDDIFLNAPLYPEDLYTESEGVRIFNAWIVPDCSDGCPWAFIRDGVCDEHCNIEDCQFDGGDCNEESMEHVPDYGEIIVHNNFNDDLSHIEHVAKIQNTTRIPKRKFFRKKRKTSFNSYLKSKNFTTPEELQEIVKKFNKKDKSLKIRPNTLNKKDVNIHSKKYSSTRDIYSQSLIHTNKLLNNIYGFKSRYVLGHVGFLLDKNILNEMHIKFNKEIEETASQRFRSSKDIQFAFLYYNFLMSETKNVSIEEIFNDFDTDDSGTWSDREIRTLLIRIFNTIPLSWEPAKYFEDVVRNCSSIIGETNENIEYSTLVYERYQDSNIPRVTKLLVLQCPQIVEALIDNFGKKSKYKFKLNIKREIFSNFMMLTSNVTEVIDSFDKFRRNPKKFNCINDDMDPQYLEVNELIKNLLEDFYLSFFPKRSQFELPDTYRNRFTNLMDYENWKFQKYVALIVCYIISVLLSGILLRFLCLYKGKYVAKYIEL